MQALVFLLVISLVYTASKHLRPRRTLLTAIVCGTVLFAGISFWVEYIPNIAWGRFMTPWTRDLNFGAAVLDLGLWALLISSRQKDYKLLLVTGALGIQFTGGAIGEALRDIERVTRNGPGHPGSRHSFHHSDQPRQNLHLVARISKIRPSRRANGERRLNRSCLNLLTAHKKAARPPGASGRFSQTRKDDYFFSVCSRFAVLLESEFVMDAVA